MNKRLSMLGIVFVMFVRTLAAVPAHAETSLGAQVLQSDLTLTKAASPYVVNGLIQIPAGKTLLIEPGAVVTFANGGGIKSLGELRVGSMNSTERVTLNLKTNLDFIGNGLIPPSIIIVRTDIYGQNSALTYGCGKLQIDETYLEKIRTIVREQECVSMSIKNSYLNNVTNIYEGFFDGHPASFILQNNQIVSMQSICCSIPDRTMGNNDPQAVYTVTNNDFKNLESLNIPYGYVNYTFSNNNLNNVKNVKIVTYFGYSANSKTEVLSSNHWGGLSTDSAIRNSIKVLDGKSDIAIQRTVVFEPVSPNAITLSGFPLSKANDIVKAASDKAASDKAASDKAASDALAAIQAAAKAASDATAKAVAAAQAAAKKAATQKTIITCVKGKLTKKVSGVNPKCPPGYVKKK